MTASKKVAAFFLISAAICSLFICLGIIYLWISVEYYAQGGGKERIVSDEEGVYAIDSQTLLQDLRSNNTNVFEYLPNGNLITSPETDLPPVHWTEADYLFIADHFNQYVSNDSLENWEYYSIAYGMDCDDFTYCPQWATFRIVKYIFSNDNKVRLERHLYIYPDEKRIGWAETGYESVFSHSSFKREQVKVSLEEALKIAEKQGGKNFRLSENNECKIFSDIVITGNRDGNWQVQYKSTDNQFVIDINKETGEYRIVEP